MKGGMGKGKDIEGETDWNMLHVYVQRQHNETHQTLYVKGRRREEWEGTGRDKLIQSTL
jgi:hypothetical protein